MRRFFCDQNVTVGSEVALGADETRHLRDVLRLRVGDSVAVFDGRGHEFEARIDRIGKRDAELVIVRESDPPAPESELRLILAVALLKSDKFDLVVQKAVELGVVRIIPLITQRCDVKFKDAGSRLERWRKIAIEASKQCGRSVVAEIAVPVGFSDFCESYPNAVLFSERCGEPLDGFVFGDEIAAATGPEGGWDDSEIECARSAGLSIVTLGGRILRAETAAITVAAIMQNRFGDLN